MGQHQTDLKRNAREVQRSQRQLKEIESRVGDGVLQQLLVPQQNDGHDHATEQLRDGVRRHTRWAMR
jgi:hypothetical protein